jgi:RNA polymerase sigma factor (sigma-70 family)
MNYDLLLRKLAWDFSQKSGLDIDDLFQEASLAYLEAVRTYDPAKSKISTYVWHCVHNRLTNYLRDYQKYSAESLEVVTITKTTNETAYFENLSDTASKIAKVVLSSPENFACLTQNEAKKRIRNTLHKEGWSIEKIFAGFKELQMIYS